VETDAVDAAVAAALAGVASSTSTAPSAAPTGPPLTSGEKNNLVSQISQCWNVGSLSSEALRTTVVVAMEMQPDGKPVSSSLRMVSFEGGNDASAGQAYEAARRAIIRCGAKGFELPSEKFDHWQEIEMVFNPERMRFK
ncbi:MAG: energy transducer TonB, partial [Pseudoruegeria sp.]